MPKCYRYQDKEYSSFFELRNAFINISFPANMTDDVLSELGVEFFEIPAPVPTLEELKEAKAAEIRAVSATKIMDIQKGYTLGEINTFEQQYTGAVEILTNGVAADISTMSKDAKFVIALAQGRSTIGGEEIAPEELAQKITTNYTAAREYTLQTLYIQQGLEAKIRMVALQEELESIEWPDLA